MDKVFIIGAGAWGTALAQAIVTKTCTVQLWARTLPIKLSIDAPQANIVSSLEDIADASAVLLATPAQTTRAMLTQLQALPIQTPLVLCAKGLCQETGARLDEVVRAWRPQQVVAYLSGPNFADEVRRGVPTASVVAAHNLAQAQDLCTLLGRPLFRLYANDDMVGVGLLGALKNVLALGAGVIAGAAATHNLGENTRAAFLTRGLAELMRLGLALGAKPATFSGLAGIGDILLTCSSPQSRNYRYGLAFGAGALPDAAMTVEGLPTLAAARALAAQQQIDAPLLAALHDLFYHQRPLAEVLQQLLGRPQKAEF